MTDEMLAERTRQGDGTAFAMLVARHSDAVYRIAANVCTSARDAEEVTRQTFLSAYRDAEARPSGATFRTWLYGIALTNAISQRRSAPRAPVVSPAVFLPRFDADGALEPAAAEWPEPDGALLERINVAGFLREALDCMAEDVRAAFVLCDLVELPAEDAAAIAGTSIDIVRRRAHRARLMLRGFLDQLWSV